ncbi:hypothetical protein [Mongoliimonas terrestris]|uniref:hypothetical protein n=1 Tax=Mongoliimonas terrestris TaxID=1709001 RepID=UPI0009499CEA|nr:hypothetical protein [Mongoliimonas terrestris]
MFAKSVTIAVAAAVLSTSIFASAEPAFAKNRNRDVAVGAFFGLAAGLLAGAAISQSQERRHADAPVRRQNNGYRPAAEPVYIDGYQQDYAATCRLQPVVRWVPGKGEVTEFKKVCP